MDKDRIRRAWLDILCEVEGTRELSKDLQKSPERIASLYEKIFSGVSQSIDSSEYQLLDSEYSGEIVIEGIDFVSFCEHHFVPFWGCINVKYLPNNNKIIGFNNILKIISVYTNRPQIQERLTQQIAKSLKDVLSAKEVTVLIEAQHFCMKLSTGQTNTTIKTSLTV